MIIDRDREREVERESLGGSSITDRQKEVKADMVSFRVASLFGYRMKEGRKRRHIQV